MDDIVATLDGVRICPMDHGVRYVFSEMRRPGWRQNGLGALIAGVVTLSGMFAMMWLLDYLALVRVPGQLGPRILYWSFCVIGVAASIPFFACFVYTVLRGGNCWLSLENGVVHVGHFFGGELANHHIPAADITDVLLEPLTSSWDSVERGRIRLVGKNIRLCQINTGEVEVGVGYPVSELRRVAEDLRQRLEEEQGSKSQG